MREVLRSLVDVIHDDAVEIKAELELGNGESAWAGTESRFRTNS